MHEFKELKEAFTSSKMIAKYILTLYTPLPSKQSYIHESTKVDWMQYHEPQCWLEFINQIKWYQDSIQFSWDFNHNLIFSENIRPALNFIAFNASLAK